MYNKIILIGTVEDDPREFYDVDANRYACISLHVPPPPDAPATHWGGIYDLRNPNWPTGGNPFLVICRDPLLAEKCLNFFRKGDVICVEGRLVLTLLRSGGELLPLAEILANDVLLITKFPSALLKEE